ncbi:MAG: (Fe-S)-binding protein [Magnetococcales bacterium]|nr:(Fe-S)-binding protein [Magnetococcales bacterium]
MIQPAKEVPGPLANADLCTQCGYCLPVCPTYRVENNELHAPRGRVSIILALQSGTLTAAEAAAALDHCLVCQTCHTACPAGVQLAHLTVLVRALVPPKSTVSSRVLHRVTNHPHLTARMAALLARYQRSGAQATLRRWGLLRLVPALARLEALLPRHRPEVSCPPFPTILPDRFDQPRIGLLGGCMARLFFPGVAPSAAQLVVQGGGAVTLLASFGCCGAPFRESGDQRAFLRQARRTLDAFVAAGPLQSVVCDSSVCAVTAQDYARALSTEVAYATVAQDFAAKVQTLSQFLAQDLGRGAVVPKDPGFGSLTYHDHCQARHGLGIIKEPRRVLTALPLVYRELWQCQTASSGGCCGAGGVYQLRHAVRSQKIRAAQVAAICASGADAVVGENPGCLLHLQAGLEQAGSAVRVYHLAEVVWAAHSLQQPTQKVSP